MTKKNNVALLNEAAVSLEKQTAELAKLKASSRGDRLRKAEASVKAAAKPTTLGGRSVQLRQAEASVAAAKPLDRRLCWREMSTK
jgi:hypothetical protein